MKQVEPFQINVSQQVLDDLATRLKQTRWTDEPVDAGWSYGTNPAVLRELVDYWQHSYDWRKAEKLLNSLPQYKATIDGVGIHFVYAKGKGPNARPIILTHEWPDSYFRFYKIISLLTDPVSHGGRAEDSFDVIIPSMPGHGFSDRVTLSSGETAELWATLMTEVLGYDTFYAGGDFSVTTALAAAYPDMVRGLFLTDTGYPNGMEDWSKMTPAEQAFGQKIQYWFFQEGAFNMIQSTKPQTLGYGLNDSPVGLASWILEKFYAWSDTRGDLWDSFTKDELLTNIMIYWVTETINTSIRRYLEDARAMWRQGGPKPMKKVSVPTALTVFPADSDTPKEWAERRVNLVRYAKQPVGGRFAALEVPKIYVEELRAAVEAVELGETVPL